jgi:hypothetical protein
MGGSVVPIRVEKCTQDLDVKTQRKQTACKT